jgi:hypothetical protein
VASLVAVIINYKYFAKKKIFGSKSDDFMVINGGYYATGLCVSAIQPACCITIQSLVSSLLGTTLPLLGQIVGW